LNLFKILKAIRCPLCFGQKESLLGENLRMLELEKQAAIQLVQHQLIKEKEKFVDQLKKFHEERRSFLDERERSLDRQREALLGKDGAEIKRKVLLPALQDKWQAEKAKLDADKSRILEKTPRVKVSLDSRRVEILMVINNIRKKPSNAPNHDLLVQNEGRLKELEEILMLIDQEDPTHGLAT